MDVFDKTGPLTLTCHPCHVKIMRPQSPCVSSPASITKSKSTFLKIGRRPMSNRPNKNHFASAHSPFLGRVVSSVVSSLFGGLGGGGTNLKTPGKRPVSFIRLPLIGLWFGG